MSGFFLIHAGVQGRAQTVRGFSDQSVKFHGRFTPEYRPPQRRKKIGGFLAREDPGEAAELPVRGKTLRRLREKEDRDRALVGLPKLAELGDARCGSFTLRLPQFECFHFKLGPLRRLLKRKSRRLSRPYEELRLHQSWNAAWHGSGAL